METNVKILLSALAADVISSPQVPAVVSYLKNSSFTQQLDLYGLARAFYKPQMLRQLNQSSHDLSDTCPFLERHGTSVSLDSKFIGNIKILYKAPLPGELQARLASESIIERFLEYLIKKHQIIVLNESDRHVQVFIPGETSYDFKAQWESFLRDIAFSGYGDSRLQMPGLIQTFIIMLNAVTLSGRGFSTLDIPILTKEQADVLAAWYLAVIQQVAKRQSERQKQIDSLRVELEASDLTDKERLSKKKDLESKEDMQTKEAKKYAEHFEKSFVEAIYEQIERWEEFKIIDSQISSSGLSKQEQSKLQKQRDKIASQITFSEEWLTEKRLLLQEIGCQPFEFVLRDQETNHNKFKIINEIAKRFDRKATDQINSTRGDIFTQCITEMYRLIELDEQHFDPLPLPLLLDYPPVLNTRLAGDDSKEFCYACGVNLDPKTAKWQVLRFMFERPSQRRQSSSGEGRPHICSSCSVLAFASPLKVTEESIVLKLLPANQESLASFRVKDYVRMLTNKEVHLSAGRYIILNSDRTNKGDLASSKLGQVQYAIAKVASIFPQEVLSDFRFQLVLQGSEIDLPNRYLLFVKGLIEGYGQSIIIAGKEINMDLGEAVRYIQQDSPYLADYSLVKVANISDPLKLELTRSIYWKELQRYMDSNSSQSKRAKLYQDVAALTGLTLAFVQSLERTAKQLMSPEDAEREVSKIIEKVDDATSFCYYATLGDEKKTSVQARLYHNPDNDFVYHQTLGLLESMNISDRQNKDDQGRAYLQLYADDISRVYMHFASKKEYEQDKDWKELTYNLKLSLYTRFPELVRKLKSSK